MRYIFFDTETTGRSPQKDRIVEIAAFDPEKGTTFERLINPRMPMPKDAMAIHQITDEMLQDAPCFAEVAQEFIEFCSGDVLLTAHNNHAFDKPLLEAELLRNSFQIPGDWKFFDSLKWARLYRPDLPRHALQYLRQIYNIEANKAHRALDDVIILAKVMQYMTDDLSAKEVYQLLLEKTKTEAPQKQVAPKEEELSLFSYKDFR